MSAARASIPRNLQNPATLAMTQVTTGRQSFQPSSLLLFIYIGSITYNIMPKTIDFLSCGGQVRFGVWQPLERPLDVSFACVIFHEEVAQFVLFAHNTGGICESDSRPLRCIGTALELYRRIGVSFREVGRGGLII